jgi:hypothetical protein
LALILSKFVVKNFSITRSNIFERSNRSFLTILNFFFLNPSEWIFTWPFVIRLPFLFLNLLFAKISSDYYYLLNSAIKTPSIIHSKIFERSNRYRKIFLTFPIPWIFTCLFVEKIPSYHTYLTNADFVYVNFQLTIPT